MINTDSSLLHQADGQNGILQQDKRVEENRGNFKIHLSQNWPHVVLPKIWTSE
jgi:hypothetical protein